MLGGFESVKPGWTRLNFGWFIDAAEFEFLQDAIEFIADHGERFIALYQFDWHSGAWTHPLVSAQPGLLALVARSGARHTTAAAPPPMSHRACLARAQEVLLAVPAPSPGSSCLPQGLPAALVGFGH